jgi:hypothetical protein
MHDADKNANRKDTVTIARLRALRRAERLDMIVASTLLLLLLFGWAVRFAPMDTWPRGDFLIATSSRHA